MLVKRVNLFIKSSGDVYTIPPVSFDLPEDVCFGMPENMLRLLNI